MVTRITTPARTLPETIATTAIETVTPATHVIPEATTIHLVQVATDLSEAGASAAVEAEEAAEVAEVADNH